VRPNRRGGRGATYVPRRGDAIRLDFDPQTGREQAGNRPALVLSPEDYNRRTGLAVVCPITNQAKGYPFEVALPEGLAVTGVVLADHIKSADWRARRAAFLCHLGDEVVAEAWERVAALLDPAEDEG
jgi:mRNA interferase MazF